MSSSWNGLLGHRAVIEQVEAAIKNQHMPHALLFSGPKSVGKRRAAQALATALLTKGLPETERTAQVRLLGSGNHPDFHVVTRVEGKKDISVEAVRELCNRVHLRPYYGVATVTLIDNAHEMSIAAGNALLMTLEEPNPENYLILVTHAPQRLPATILSRCQIIHFGTLLKEEVSAIINDMPGVSAEQRSALLDLCEGSLEALHLSPFVDPVTNVLTDQKSLRTHIQDLIGRTERLQDDIDGYLRQVSDDALQSAQALNLAAQLSGQSEDLPFAWRLLNNGIRKHLRHSPPKQSTRWAELLEHSLQAEKLCRERNVNPLLQLTTLLMEPCR